MTAHLHHLGWLAVSLSLLAAGCSSATGDAPAGTSPQGDAPVAQQSRTVIIDGSSTVFPITEAIAESFNANTANRIEADVSFSGTTGGFKKFCAGQTDINLSSTAKKQLVARL